MKNWHNLMKRDSEFICVAVSGKVRVLTPISSLARAGLNTCIGYGVVYLMVFKDFYTVPYLPREVSVLSRASTDTPSQFQSSVPENFRFHHRLASEV